MAIRDISTKPYLDQKSGTAGLRKKVAVFQQPHYLENFLQSIFDCVPELRGGTLVIGGDGRYYNRTAIQTACAVAAGNGVARIVVGQGGLLSTPAASILIRKRAAQGGLLFTASHNPAGPDGDFGIKFNITGGGQANEGLTNRIYEASKTLTRYRAHDGGQVDLDRRGLQTLGNTEIEVVDCVEDYSQLMQQLFDFDRIRDWFKRGHTLRFDAMHAVTGPYAERIFVEQLGAPLLSVQNASPLEDFGGGHPDPNLIYAKPLVDLAFGANGPDLAAASDGDGDRNMILGKGIFISPGDSLAMLAAHLHELPGYRRGLAGLARSMPTCRAADKVAKALAIPLYETPTGWKFFANLLDAGKLTLCGEESFGTSSDHAREKDGLWAVLAWLNVLAVSGLSVKEIAQNHWKRFGRHYYARHDYDELSGQAADSVMQSLANQLSELPGRNFGDYTVSEADEFSYRDPEDNSIAVNQGLRVIFSDQARIILRLSGTGTKGSTLRVYLERYETRESSLNWDTREALAPLVNLADKITRIGELTGRKAPSVVT
ncbi:alpha-D-glucose phosphate-specific phosphoglucomutase [Solimonas sp. K1W22B-7]|uniref:alpha-D-glucose phosphate-specific phosphoglucomutase n=1 Tax=Solimonas sp. K1W22B-7 TaxID=2303331 RepID=UPI000E336212|nr:alpha-D-glucose phosphate-specific phosphoglucomutase [Solimonas sp. K1W22B-7]AXQ29177.1 alpha-D-glucose phosphate-specific phosphoglucomutase [Solimonas sp. K1W22B-7]